MTLHCGQRCSTFLHPGQHNVKHPNLFKVFRYTLVISRNLLNFYIQHAENGVGWFYSFCGDFVMAIEASHVYRMCTKNGWIDSHLLWNSHSNNSNHPNNCWFVNYLENYSTIFIPTNILFLVSYKFIFNSMCMFYIH